MDINETGIYLSSRWWWVKTSLVPFVCAKVRKVKQEKSNRCVDQQSRRIWIIKRNALPFTQYLPFLFLWILQLFVSFTAFSVFASAVALSEQLHGTWHANVQQWNLPFNTEQILSTPEWHDQTPLNRRRGAAIGSREVHEHCSSSKQILPDRPPTDSEIRNATASKEEVKLLRKLHIYRMGTIFHIHRSHDIFCFFFFVPSALRHFVLPSDFPQFPNARQWSQ